MGYDPIHSTFTGWRTANYARDTTSRRYTLDHGASSDQPTNLCSMSHHPCVLVIEARLERATCTSSVCCTNQPCYSTKRESTKSPSEWIRTTDPDFKRVLL